MDLGCGGWGGERKTSKTTEKVKSSLGELTADTYQRRV